MLFSDKHKMIALLSAAIVLSGSFSGFQNIISADTGDDISQVLNDLQDSQSENDKRIDKLKEDLEKKEQQLSDSQNDTVILQEYQDSLNEKISLQHENIRNIQQQIDLLAQDIENKNQSIEELQSDIQQKELDMQDELDEFKQRLRAMYISGNDSIASIITGSTSFFDVLSRIEFIRRVADYDNKLVNSIESQLEKLNSEKETLENQLTRLSEDKQEVIKKQAEYTMILAELNSDYQKTSEEMYNVMLRQEALENDRDIINSQLDEAEKEQEEIEKAILDAQETIKKLSETTTTVTTITTPTETTPPAPVQTTPPPNTPQSSPETNPAPIVTTTPTPVQTTPPVTTTTPPPVIQTTPKYVWPVPSSYIISDYFTERTWNSQGFHYGLDIAAGDGTPIVAAESGTVILVKNECTHNYGKSSSCGCGGGYGRYVIIDHGGTYATLYGHCSDITVNVGDRVERGQVIGAVGSTGYSTGFHLHFEVRENGVRINPLPFISY